MLCHLYSFASFVMLCALGYPLVNSFMTNSTDFTDISADNRTQDYNQTDIISEIISDFEHLNASTGGANETLDDVLSASSAQQLTWVRSTDGKYVSVKPDPNRNSSHLLKNLLKVFHKNGEKREDLDLGLPPDIAHEYIDAVNPPKFRIPLHYSGHHQYIKSSIAPSTYETRLQNAGSTVVKTKANYTSSSHKQSQSPNANEMKQNMDLHTLLKAELDAKRDELDQTNVYTPSPNLFALLPTNMKTDNPFVESNYKTPNRVKTSTHRPYVTSPNSVNHFHSPATNVGQFVYSDGMQSIRVNVPSNKPMFAITTPNSINLITTSSATNVVVLRSTTTSTTSTTSSTTTTPTTTVRPVHYTKLKIKTMSTSTTTRSTPKTTTTTKTTKAPTLLISTTIADKNNNKSIDWSSRVNNHTSDRSSESNDSINQIGLTESTGSQSHEPYINDNTILRSTKNKKIVSEDYYITTESTANKTDYSAFDYADNSALNPNYTVPDGFADYPGANYRLTTERLAYILIGSCCALSILCLIVVAMSVRCRDMCDEYRSWKKAEKAALRWQRHQYRLAHHQQDLSRYFRTSVEPNPENTVRPTPNVITAPAPLFGPACCHCISCSSSWLFRDANKPGREWCCQRGYYHPASRGKLPFGAASSVNTFMPRYANNNSNPNNNCCDEGDTDSLNTSDLLDTHQNRHHLSDCNPPNTRTEQSARRQQLRRIAQPNGNQNWIHSSEIVEDLHKKHTNINNITREQSNQNNFRARNRQIGNENIVVWNNNDERLI